MDSLRDQGDIASGPLSPAGRKPWTPPRVIVSMEAASAQAKTAVPNEGGGPSSPTNFSIS
jgi:hypothetical protein